MRLQIVLAFQSTIMEVEKQRPLSDLAKFAISLDEETDVVDLKKKSGRGEL